MTYCIYAIRSLNHNYIYVGMTNDLQRRIEEHNSGYNKSTKPYLPFVLIFQTSAPSRNKAREIEKYYKTAAGKKYLRSLDF